MVTLPGIFSPEALQKQVDAAIAVVPEDKNALVVRVTNEEGVQVLVGVRTANGWTVAAQAIKPHEKPWEYGVQVQYEW